MKAKHDAAQTRCRLTTGEVHFCCKREMITYRQIYSKRSKSSKAFIAEMLPPLRLLQLKQDVDPQQISEAAMSEERKASCPSPPVDSKA